MLVLSRKVNEELVITMPDGTQVSVVVVDIRGDKVRVGVHAPRDVAVHRREVHDAIERNHGRAVSLSQIKTNQEDVAPYGDRPRATAD